MKQFSVFFLLMVLFFSCKKEVAPECESVICESDHSDPDTVIYGDCGSMIMYEVNDTVAFSTNLGVPSGYSQTHGIDFYNDGVTDFEIKRIYSSSQGGGSSAFINMVCSNENASFNGVFTADSIFKKVVVSIIDQDPIILHTYTSISCIQIDESYEFSSISPVFELTPKDELEVLHVDDPFNSTEITLRRSATSFFVTPSSSGDTILGYVNENLRNCYEFPLDEEKYIGVRMESFNGPKLGWIRIKLINNSMAVVMGYAIQE